MAQTAVEWFYQRILAKDIKEVFEQAKLMEKENLEDCWIAAHQAGRFEGKGIAEEDWQTFFNYYNETYNK
jgi:hypothetical protein